MALIQGARQSEHFTHIQEHWEHLELYSYTCNQAKTSRIKQKPRDCGVALCIHSWWLGPAQVMAKTCYSWWLAAPRRSWWSGWPSELAKVLWKPEGGLDDLVHGLSSTMPEMANGLLVSALVLVTWEVTRPLGVKTWIRGDCQIIDTTGKNPLASFTFKH
jgi:hypothetical protein